MTDLHRLWTTGGGTHRPEWLSTSGPQAEAGCPQLPASSPQGCPLFGNTKPAITVSSERRHTGTRAWPVGNGGKPGDAAGEKWPPPVHGVCTTFPRPQNTLDR